MPSCCTAGLRSLDLGFNRFDRLPLALSTATQLTRLSLQGDHNFVVNLESDDDLLLAHLHALRELDLVCLEQQAAQTPQSYPAVAALARLSVGVAWLTAVRTRIH